MKLFEIKQIMTELLDSEVEIKLMHALSEEFATSCEIDGNEYKFYADVDYDALPHETEDDEEGYKKASKIWEIKFALQKPKANDYSSKVSLYHKTGTGNQMKVFSFVMKSLDMFMKKYDHPKIVQFTADEPSRVKLYRKMLARYNGLYKVHEHETPLTKTMYFTLIKKD